MFFIKNPRPIPFLFLSLLRWRYFMTFYSRSFCILLKNFQSFASFDYLFADFWIYTQTFYATSKYPYVKCVVDKGNNKTRAHSHARRKLAINTSVSISTVCCCWAFFEQSIRQTSFDFTISLLFVSKDSIVNSWPTKKCRQNLIWIFLMGNWLRYCHSFLIFIIVLFSIALFYHEWRSIFEHSFCDSNSFNWFFQCMGFLSFFFFPAFRNPMLIHFRRGFVSSVFQSAVFSKHIRHHLSQ